MNVTVIRQQPVEPPVEKIMLEVTPAELIMLRRVVGQASLPARGWNLPSFDETDTGRVIGQDRDPLGNFFYTLGKAAREIGLAK